MRVSALIVSFALASTAVTPVAAAVPASELSPASVQLTKQANSLMGEAKPLEAIDFYETALAADPRNVSAYLGLGRAYESIKLTGKALKFYREALTIDPNSTAALRSQGAIYAQRGRTQAAEANLKKLRKLCGECADTKALSQSIRNATERAEAN